MAKGHHVKNFTITTLMMLGVYAVFVGFFFFTYGAYTEKKVVRNEINILVDNFTEDFIFFGQQTLPDEFQNIKKYINDITAPDLSEADKKVEENNSKLVKTAIIALSITFVICIGLSIAVWYFGFSKKQRATEPYSEFMQRIVLLIIIVAFVEFLFFTLVAGNYRPVDPNSIKKKLVESLQNYAKTISSK